MAARREVDRRGNDRTGERDDNAYRKQPARTTAEPPRRPQLNEYWIDGEGLSREVLQTEICKYLGNDATCRPGDYQGTPGFKIKALRPFTPDMLDDLRTMSKQYMNENRVYKARHDREIAYTESETYEKSNPAMEFHERNYPGRDSPSFQPPSAYGAPPPGAPAGFTTTSAGYSGLSTYAVHPGIPAVSPMPADPRYSGPEYNYAHVPPSSRDARDPRDPRDPREIPYGSSYQGHGGHYPPGPYANEPYRVDPRADPRVDPRMNQDYYNQQYPTGGRDPRMDTSYYGDQMQGMPGPGAYPAGPSARGAISPYDNQGRDPYGRGTPTDPRYVRR